MMCVTSPVSGSTSCMYHGIEPVSNEVSRKYFMYRSLSSSSRSKPEAMRDWSMLMEHRYAPDAAGTELARWAVGPSGARRCRSGAAEREHELRGVHVALRLRTHIAEARLLVATLRVEYLEYAHVAFLIALLCHRD